MSLLVSWVRRARRRPRPLLGVATLLAVGGAALMGLGSVNVGGAVSALGRARPELLGLAVVLYFVGQTVSGGMWGVCQAAGGVRVPMATTLGLHWIVRATCELLPMGLGEALRVAAVRRHPDGARAGTWRIAGSLAGYKAIDGAVTAAVVLVIALATPLPGPAAGLRWSALVAVAGIAGGAVAWRLGRARLRARRLPEGLRRVASRMSEGAGVMGDRSAGRLAAMLALLAIAARIGSLAALLGALGIAPQAAPLAFAAIVLAGVVPGAPGGAGTREVVLLPALALAHGVSSTHALAFSVAIQATALATSLVAGAIALAWLGPALLAGRRAAGDALPVAVAADDEGLAAAPVTTAAVART